MVVCVGPLLFFILCSPTHNTAVESEEVYFSTWLTQENMLPAWVALNQGLFNLHRKADRELFGALIKACSHQNSPQLTADLSATVIHYDDFLSMSLIFGDSWVTNFLTFVNFSFSYSLCLSCPTHINFQVTVFFHRVSPNRINHGIDQTTAQKYPPKGTKGTLSNGSDSYA